MDTSFCIICHYFCIKVRCVMNADNKISRRNFIRTSVAAGGALLASTSIAGQTMDVLRGQKNDKKSDNDGLLKGVCDIHLLVRQNPARLIGLN